MTARGEQLVTGLREALAASPHVKQVRGAGLLVGIELDVMAGPVVEVRFFYARSQNNPHAHLRIRRRAAPRGC